ncbi:SRPBCC family protein [Terrabacter sp. NPDC080008]|uniref:SRPBCC family protein n=1 Tax=Terrabacter sp. NPDC080008 TaxID=3155176 RepID=UPI00344C67D4
MPRIVLATSVPASAQRCFELSLSVDAHTASMSRSGERVVGGVRAGVMELGDTVTWRARHFGLPFTMTSRITDLVAPNRFVDEQVSGPFAHWWHEHVFEQREKTTLMTDTVEFTSPAGPIGRLVDAVILTKYMTRLLTQRNRWLVHALS